MVMFTVASCNQKGGSISNNPKAKALDDSISQVFGDGLGMTIAMHANDSTPEAKKFDKEAFLAGLKDALKNDTTPKSQRAGVSSTATAMERSCCKTSRPWRHRAFTSTVQPS